MKRIITLSFLLGPVIHGFSQDTIPGSCQMGSIIQVDGRASEWPMTWIEDPDKKFSYNVCSDDNSLYIRLRTTDDIVKRKMAMFGFTVWMDPNGKKKRKLGLRFPTGMEAKERMSSGGPSPNHESMTSAERAKRQQELQKSMIADLEVIELIGLTDDPLTSTRSGITNGIKVAIDVDEEGGYTYEAVIPLKSYRLSKTAIPVLGIGFETGKYIPEAKQGSAGAGGGGGSGGSGGRGSGGHHGGGRGKGFYSGATQSGGAQQMATSTTLWTTLNLK